MLTQEQNIISTGERETGGVEQDDLREQLCQVERLVETLKTELIASEWPWSSRGTPFTSLTSPFWMPSASLMPLTIDWSKLQPVKVILRKHKHLMKVCSVGRLACKLARFSNFGEDVLREYMPLGKADLPALPRQELARLKCILLEQFIAATLLHLRRCGSPV